LVSKGIVDTQKRSEMASQKLKSPMCKNCSYVFEEAQPDEFCPQCGQENNERIVSLGRFLKDFTNQYLVVDSKMSVTIGTLLFIPGKLSLAYSQGRIASYVIPFRLYFIISLVYFSIFSAKLLSLVDNTPPMKVLSGLEKPFTNEEGVVVNLKDSILQEVKEGQPGSFHFFDNKVSIDRVFALADKYDATTTMDTLKKEYPFFNNNPVATTITKQIVKLYQSQGKDFVNYFIGMIPLMMLLMMPLLALIFNLLYIRSKRYFVEHLVFFLHIHSFLYLLLVLYMLIWGFNGQWLPWLLLISTIYLMLSMKKMYGQGWFKTILKQSIFMIFCYPLFFVVYLISTLAVSFLLF